MRKPPGPESANGRSFRDDDRAASEVLGFVLVFSLVAATVGVVYVGGFTSLQSAQDAERVNNAVRAFDVLEDNVNDVVAHGAPSRATEIKLGGASLYMGAPVTLNVTAEAADGSTVGPHSATLRPIVYEADRTKLVYSAGAVIREDRGGSVIQTSPPFLFDSARTVIPYVHTRSAKGGSSGVGGQSTVLVRTVGSDRALLAGATGDAPYDVTFNVTTSRSDVWERHLEERLDGRFGDADHCSTVGNTVTCEFQTDRVYVAVTRIDVSFA